MSNYTLRKLDDNEFDILIPLMQNCFGIEANINYFKWKYIDNPAGKFVGFIAVAEDGEIGGYYGVIPQKYIIEGNEIIIYQSCDTMTHSNHRRKGLFQKLALCCYDYLKQNNKLFVIGFGGGQSTPGFLKFGWVHIFDVKYYFFPKLFGKLNVLGYGSFIGVEFLKTKDIDKIAHLIIDSNNKTLIHSNKTVDYYKWRISNPRYNYQILVIRNENIISSFLCFYEEDNKLLLFDYFFKDKKDGKKLMGYLKRKMLTENKIGIIAYCQENSFYSKEISKYNFISNPTKKGPLASKTPFIIFASDVNMTKYNSPNYWNINSFDHDAM